MSSDLKPADFRLSSNVISSQVGPLPGPLTAAEKAAELGIARGTLTVLLKSHGQHYKQPSPEHRHAVHDAARERRARLHTRHWL